MSKLILENKTDLPMNVFLDMCKDVIKAGRISNKNKQYSYACGFNVNNERYYIYSELNKKSDKLVLIKQ